MNHQKHTQQLTELLLMLWSRMLPRSMAIATVLGTLTSGISAAQAVPIPDVSPHSSAVSLSETVLVPEMEDGASTSLTPIPLAQTSPESTTNESEEEYRFGDRGDNRWYIQAGAATTLDNNEARRLGLVGAGLSHFFLNGHSINLELNGLAFDQTGDDAAGLNLNAMLRWHLHRADNWSVYVDGGAGLLGTTNDVPAAGSQLNFTPQVGAGATIRLKDEERLMVGLRWHHISNADLYPPNPGRDSLYGYVGWNLPR